LPLAASADLRDRLQDLDLNAYAFGAGYSTMESPYVGGADSRAVYPHLSSVFPSALDEEILFSRDGGWGLRWFPNHSWEFGALARVQTLGFDASDSASLAGLESRDWTVEVSPTFAWRGDSFQISGTAFVDLLRNQTGVSYALVASAPVPRTRGYLIPEIGLHTYSRDFVDYYFGVPANAAIAGRPEYAGRSATGLSFGAAWGTRLFGNWLLTGRIGVEVFGSGISDSPIVKDRDRTAASLQLAYDGTPFRPPTAGQHFDGLPIELSFESAQLDAATAPTSGAAASSTRASYLDTTLTLAGPHRVSIGVYDSRREFADSSRDFAVRRVEGSYGFDFLDDDQKRLTLRAGMHWTENDAHTSRAAPLIGIDGRARFANKLALTGRARWLDLDSDVDGAKTELYVSLAITHRTFRHIELGAGYAFSRTRYEPAIERSALYRGPSLFLIGTL
jgi:outer membrane scaffolding protein for murein synthesis (MipA/OmpV family)